MSPEEDDERRRRYDRNVRLGRGLAERLAVEAENIAATLDRLAHVHEELAATDRYPLKVEALARAAQERRMAESERRASVWFRSVASGSHRREAPRPPASLDQRLPSQ